MNSSKLIERLQQSLQLEYSLIVHYPRISGAVTDEAIKDIILKLGKTSVDHANIVATTIKSLGSEPRWSFEPFPETADIIDIFELQLEKEKLAYQIHKQNSIDVSDRALKEKFNDIAEEEMQHIKIVKEILSKLKDKPDGLVITSGKT